MKRPFRRHPERHQRGQSLVEFALVIPIFFIAAHRADRVRAGVQRRPRDQLREPRRVADRRRGGQRGRRRLRDPQEASRTGSARPRTHDQVIDVTIYSADTERRSDRRSGQNVYARGGSMVVPAPERYLDGSLPPRCDRPGYPETTRCNILAGCWRRSDPRPRSASTITLHVHLAHPAEGSFIGLAGRPATRSTSRTSMRMEPVL